MTAELTSTTDPTGRQLAAIAADLERPRLGGLPERAAAVCPDGYDIARRDPPQSAFQRMLPNGVPLYRVWRDYYLLCS
ncbi:hypothetical protein [Paracoccus pacificus]|uniref:Uncharacterized protein n=1 Tax=Paracoccus pacificus TaxID=1463598 RepID=A0ABW4R8B4_9RHOB